MQKTMIVIKITDDISPLDLQYAIKSRDLMQKDLAKIFNVSSVAISRAIKGERGFRTLRKRIIQLLRSDKKVKNEKAK